MHFTSGVEPVGAPPLRKAFPALSVQVRKVYLFLRFSLTTVRYGYLSNFFGPSFFTGFQNFFCGLLLLCVGQAPANHLQCDSKEGGTGPEGEGTAGPSRAEVHRVAHPTGPRQVSQPREGRGGRKFLHKPNVFSLEMSIIFFPERLLNNLSHQFRPAVNCLIEYAYITTCDAKPFLKI
jgi:hypothetical protein